MKLEDVARSAGVSTATVSRVLNNIGVVKTSTRTRVLKAIAELKYSPNMHARALASSASRTIGLVVSNLENPFFQDVFRSLDQRALEHGYEVLVAHTNYEPERLVTAVQTMLGRRVAGLALAVSELDRKLLNELAEREVRTVVYDVGRPRATVASIKTDYRGGMQRIAEYLYGLGHRRMAFVGHHTTLGPLNDRRQVFLDEMQRYAPKVEFTTIADADGFAGGRAAARQLIDSGFRPTAILCVNDFMAFGVCRQLHEFGLNVPRDVSVTGFDNIALAANAVPSLTTANVPRELIGEQMFACLMGATPRKEIVIEPELLIRESTGPAAL
jgi:LacI family transcriptional regulator